MKFTPYGGAREVGRSCFELEKEDRSIFLDAGVKLVERGMELPLIEELGEVVLSHAHLDHIGFLPLAKFERAYCTKPTYDLSGILWADERRICECFSTNQLNKAKKNLEVRDVGKAFNVNGFKVELFDAGHILGSAMIRVDEEVLYTGDFNPQGTRIVPPAKPVKARTLIVDSTYGRKEESQPSKKEAQQKLVSLINETISKGGCVIIPSFAVGRGQEILLTLEALMRSGVIRKVPIYVDGMIKKAMRIYRQNVIYARKEIQMQILASLHDPFLSPLFKTSRHKRREDVKRPCIVVTTSGMLSGGPVFHYLKLFGGDENSLLLFVGYQAEHTLGREVLEGKRTIEREDETIELKLKVEQVRMSGHADRASTLRFINTVRPEKVVLVHGDEEACEELAEDIKKAEVIIPSLKESVEL